MLMDFNDILETVKFTFQIRGICSSLLLQLGSLWGAGGGCRFLVLCWFTLYCAWVFYYLSIVCAFQKIQTDHRLRLCVGWMQRLKPIWNERNRCATVPKDVRQPKIEKRNLMIRISWHFIMSKLNNTFHVCEIEPNLTRNNDNSESQDQIFAERMSWWNERKARSWWVRKEPFELWWKGKSDDLSSRVPSLVLLRWVLSEWLNCDCAWFIRIWAASPSFFPTISNDVGTWDRFSGERWKWTQSRQRLSLHSYSDPFFWKFQCPNLLMILCCLVLTRR